ncbi:MAG TPA: hypothetical protein VGW38_24485 [Chloroflexota bacterium]|nr:hypothetical protein [Chloroflexota bacterium]
MAARNGALGDPLSTRNKTPAKPDAQRSTDLGRYQQVDDVDNDPPDVLGIRLSSNQPYTTMTSQNTGTTASTHQRRISTPRTAGTANAVRNAHNAHSTTIPY